MNAPVDCVEVHRSEPEGYIVGREIRCAGVEPEIHAHRRHRRRKGAQAPLPQAVAMRFGNESVVQQVGTYVGNKIRCRQFVAAIVCRRDYPAVFNAQGTHRPPRSHFAAAFGNNACERIGEKGEPTFDIMRTFQGMGDKDKRVVERPERRRGTAERPYGTHEKTKPRIGYITFYVLPVRPRVRRDACCNLAGVCAIGVASFVFFK